MDISTLGLEMSSPLRFVWQCEITANLWQDYEADDAAVLEASWRQQIESEDLAIKLENWPEHIFLLSELEQINTTSGTRRNMRRLLLLAEGTSGSWDVAPEPSQEAEGANQGSRLG
jgi:hypothetical protein